MEIERFKMHVINLQDELISQLKKTRELEAKISALESSYSSALSSKKGIVINFSDYSQKATCKTIYHEQNPPTKKKSK